MIRLTLAPADELERQLIDAKITGFLREQRLVPGRKFRADFSWRGHALAVEVDGGNWSRQGGKRCRLCGLLPPGYHVSGRGREIDCEKNNLTVLEGWRTLIVTAHQVHDGKALEWIREALSVSIARP